MHQNLKKKKIRKLNNMEQPTGTETLIDNVEVTGTNK